jgi:hypothetical protein
VSLSAKDSELIVKSVRPVRFNLDEILAGVAAANRHRSPSRSQHSHGQCSTRRSCFSTLGCLVPPIYYHPTEGESERGFSAACAVRDLRCLRVFKTVLRLFRLFIGLPILLLYDLMLYLSM